MASQSNILKFFAKKSQDKTQDKVEKDEQDIKPKESDVLERKRAGNEAKNDEPVPKKKSTEVKNDDSKFVSKMFDEKWMRQHKWLVCEYDSSGRKLLCSICIEAAQFKETIRTNNTFVSGNYSQKARACTLCVF